MKPTDEKLGNDLLELYRERRKCEVKTLNGHKPVPYSKVKYQSITDQIDILAKTIGGRARTRIRKSSTVLAIIYIDA